MSQKRLDKVNSQIRRILSEIIRHEIDDPAAEFLSITRVDITADLQECRVYYSLLTDKYEHTQEMFKRTNGFLRGLLGHQLKLRVTPALSFFPDESIKYSVDIHKTIEDVIHQDQQHIQQRQEHEHED